ncbi:MAG: hypothetical protein O2962_09105 [Cyanobacteria bacterium]|nr:hypothetical protein [Cyanobacteriota bacterium]
MEVTETRHNSAHVQRGVMAARVSKAFTHALGHELVASSTTIAEAESRAEEIAKRLAADTSATTPTKLLPGELTEAEDKQLSEGIFPKTLLDDRGYLKSEKAQALKAKLIKLSKNDDDAELIYCAFESANNPNYNLATAIPLWLKHQELGAAQEQS